MHILALVPSPHNTAPGQRYRIEQWEPLLREFGVQISFAPFKSEELNQLLCQPGRRWQKFDELCRAFVRRARLIRSVGEYDAVYIYNEAALLGPAILERLIGRSGVPIIYDFDDAIFLPYTYISPANGYLRLLKFPMKTRAICQIAAHVMVGNSYLAAYARRMNNQVTIVPSTIDTTQYRAGAREPGADVPVIGWTGSYSTLQYLDRMKGVLQRLATRERFRLRVVGVPDYRIEGVDVEALPWRPETEVQDLLPIDIGIMPLPDDRWTRGKCGMKALQYMALGLPVVCSPVGASVDIIRNGENGFLAHTEEEWMDRLTGLLRDPLLRERLGTEARKTVETKYCAVLQAPRVFHVLNSVVRSSDRLQLSETNISGTRQSNPEIAR
jgi:glycosyltransferase involved in cell wall biosynthesis